MQKLWVMINPKYELCFIAYMVSIVAVVDDLGGGILNLPQILNLRLLAMLGPGLEDIVTIPLLEGRSTTRDSSKTTF